MQRQNSASSIVKDEDSPNEKRMVAFARGKDKDYWSLVEQMETSLAKATTENDEDSMYFYRHLLSYLDAKAERLCFSLGSDKDIIVNKIASFQLAKEKYEHGVKENMPGCKIYKHWLRKVINDCKIELPLALDNL